MARYVDVEGYRKLFDEEYKKTRELIYEGETHLDNLAEGFSEASRVIDRMPTADVVEVVRCKECVWWEARTYGSTIGRCENPRNGLVSEYSEHTDFCSYGERKGGE